LLDGMVPRITIGGFVSRIGWNPPYQVQAGCRIRCRFVLSNRLRFLMGDCITRPTELTDFGGDRWPEFGIARYRVLRFNSQRSRQPTRFEVVVNRPLEATPP